jgi:CRISPR-associated nuclease/helicase Cas3-like protein
MATIDTREIPRPSPVMVSAWRRVGQFWRHTSARVTPQERANAERVLGPLAPLFFELPVNDQRHGLDVLETVYELTGEPSPILQQAALLHDLGKAGAHFSVVERSLTVFLQAVSPWTLKALLRWRPALARRYRIYVDHARIGAERLRAACAADLAAVVAEHHATDPQSEVVRQLQRADRRN